MSTFVSKMFAQNCISCPSCNQAVYVYYCVAEYDYGMNQNLLQLGYGQELCNIEATECLQDYGYNPGSTGDAPEMVVGTACDPPFSECMDTELENFDDFTVAISDAFHACAGAAGCGNTW